MKIGIYQFNTDIRAMFKNPVLIVCLLVYLFAVLAIFFYYKNAGPVQSIYLVKKLIGPYPTCLSMLLMVHIYYTNYMSDNGKWLKSHPYSGSWMIIGSFFSVTAFMSIFASITLIAFFCSSYIWGFQGVSFWYMLKNLTASLELLYILSVSYGLFMAAVIRHYAAYLITFMSWMLIDIIIPHVILGKFIGLIITIDPFVKTVQGTYPEWGLTLIHREQTILWLIIISLSLLFISIALLSTALLRPTKKFLGPVIAVVIAFCFLSISLIGHFRYWSNQKAELDEHRSVSVYTADIFSPSQKSLEVRDYLIDVFKENDSWIVYSQLSVHSSESIPGEDVFFTINPDLNVEQITVNGTIVNFTQNNGTISFAARHFNFDSGDQTVSFVYSGKINEWGMEADGKQNWFAFANDRHFYIPAALAWYPLPGKIPIYINEHKNVYRVNQGSASTNEPVNYTVRMHGFDTAVLTTQLTNKRTENDVQILTAENTFGMTVFSGSFETWESKGLDVILPIYYEKLRPQWTSKVASIRDFLQSTFNTPISGKIISLPMAESKTGTDEVGDALIISCGKTEAFSSEETIMDYLLTRGNLLNGNRGKSMVNQAFVTGLSMLYHYKDGSITPSNLSTNNPMVRQVSNALAHHDVVKLKRFFSALLEDQKDRTRPNFTANEWHVIWEDTFKGI
ncbi:MAG: hypothetical protein ACO1OC_13390 [Tuberibacillus sp.]